MENLLEILAARHLLYVSLQSLMGSEPTDELLDSIDSQLLGEALVLMGVDDGAESADEIGCLLSERENLSGLYSRLFLGPNQLASPPWESVYRSNSRALFQRSTLDVRNAYREQGLLPQRYPRVADDHIALELGFLAALAKRALDDVQVGKIPEARDALQATGRFLDEHLLTWIGDYARDLAAAEPGSLYALVARVAIVFAQRDRIVVNEVMEQL